jgi:hypothetical protein
MLYSLFKQNQILVSQIVITFYNIYLLIFWNILFLFVQKIMSFLIPIYFINHHPHHGSRTCGIFIFSIGNAFYQLNLKDDSIFFDFQHI